jgi:isopenicillin-N epimerase
MLKSILEEFDLDPGLTYLNSGTHSICPRSVTDAQIGYLRTYERNPTAALRAVSRKLWNAQAAVAAFFNAEPQDLFLTPNVTQAMNAFLLGVQLPEAHGGNGEILISDQEYGGVRKICEFRAQRDGLKIRTVALPATFEEMQSVTPEDLTDRVVRALTPETRLVMLSHIVAATGLVLPIEKIASETRRRGILFAVDGAHAPGSLPIDFGKLSSVDFYGGNLHKWMMGPKGTAFGWAHRSVQPRMKTIQAGWTTFDAPAEFAPFSEYPFQCQVMMAGCRDYSPFLALEETVQFWKKYGAESIRARLSELDGGLENEISRKLGWKSLRAKAPSLQSPLLAFELPARLASKGPALSVELLERSNLQIAIPPLGSTYCARFTPHIYNAERDFERAIEVLAKI